jgi:hypothetical protein
VTLAHLGDERRDVRARGVEGEGRGRSAGERAARERDGNTQARRP